MKPDQSLRKRVKQELLTASERFDSFRTTIEEKVNDTTISYRFTYNADKEKIYADADASNDIFEAAVYPKTTGSWIDCLLFNDRDPSRFKMKIRRQNTSDLYKPTLRYVGTAFRNAYESR